MQFSVTNIGHRVFLGWSVCLSATRPIQPLQDRLPPLNCQQSVNLGLHISSDFFCGILASGPVLAVTSHRGPARGDPFSSDAGRCAPPPACRAPAAASGRRRGSAPLGAGPRRLASGDDAYHADLPTLREGQHVARPHCAGRFRHARGVDPDCARRDLPGGEAARLEEARLPKATCRSGLSVAGRSGLVLQPREGLRKGVVGVDPVPLLGARGEGSWAGPHARACRHGGAACRRVSRRRACPRTDRGACCPPRRGAGPLPPPPCRRGGGPDEGVEKPPFRVRHSP